MVVEVWDMNAIPVVELALPRILLSCRGYYGTIRDYYVTHDQGNAKEFHPSGVNGEIVRLIGAGMIGKRLSELLKSFGFRVVVQDPYLIGEQATELGVEKISLEELFSWR